MIRFQQASKRFGALCAVDRLTMSIDGGEVVALLGPNGSGKTTTLKMAAGLIRPDAGEVTIDDPPRAAWDPSARHALSFLPQHVAFPDALTGREVVDFYRRLRSIPAERSDTVLRFAALNGAGERPVGTYSGGMVQRLGLAVAALPDVDALLLDEPTASLDPEGLQAFYRLVDERRGSGRSVAFTTHQVADVDRVADRVVVMAKGRIAGEYTRKALRAWKDERGVMRVRLVRPVADVLPAIRAFAPTATADGPLIIVPGSARLRPVVLGMLRSAGAAIAELTAEEGSLESLYAELLAGAEAQDRHA